MKESSDYRKAYEAAKYELSALLAEQDRVEKRLVVVRKSLQTLAALCEEVGIEVESSKEADYLLEHTSVADEIRSILRSKNNKAFRPREVVDELEALGRDVALFQNPQATVHMILKRLAESKEAAEGIDNNGKKTYQWRHLLRSLSEQPNKRAATEALRKRIALRGK